MEFKEKKGPWKVSVFETDCGIKSNEIHYVNDGKCVAEHVSNLDDANLIAAAPELLEACQAAIKIKDLWCYDTEGSKDDKISKIKEMFFDEIQTVNAMKDKLESAIQKALGQ